MQVFFIICLYRFFLWRYNYQDGLGILITCLASQYICGCLKPDIDFHRHVSWSWSGIRPFCRFKSTLRVVDHFFLLKVSLNQCKHYSFSDLFFVSLSICYSFQCLLSLSLCKYCYININLKYDHKHFSRAF